MNEPRVWIITINRNWIEDTRKCLDSLLELDYSNFKIYLIDNNSNNQEWEILKNEYKEKVDFTQHAENSWFTWWCNTWIKKALNDKCDYRLLFNNDAIAEKEFLQSLVEIAELDNKIWIIWPAILYPNNQTIWCNWWILDIYTWMTKAKDKWKDKIVLVNKKSHEVDYVCWACFLCKSQVSKDIWLLDEDYFAYYEEVDYSYRAKKAWWKNVQVPNISVTHDVSSSTDSWQHGISSTKAYLVARNWILFGKKNLLWFQKLWYLIMQYSIKFALLWLFHIRDRKSMFAYIRWLKWGIYWSIGKDGI